MLNGGSLNSHALNAPSSGVFIVGSGSIIFFEQIVEAIAVGSLISIEQSQGFVASGQLIQIEQSQQLLETGVGTLISLEQAVSSILSGSLINIEQRTVNSVLSHLDRTGWDCTFTIAGAIVPNDQIHGEIFITRTEGSASLMDITIIPTLGFQPVQFYAGKTVTLDAHTVDGTFRLYTGVIDIPELDLIQKKITFRCTDRRTEQINSQLGAVVKTIGYFSPLVFQDIRDTADELDKRLSTTPQSVDFDSFGIYTLSSLFPKAVADFTLNDEDIYYRDPTVQIASRGRIVNKINIDFQYRYERLHHVKRSFEWESPINDNIFLLLRDSYSLTFRDMVKGAIDAAGWPIQGDVTFTDIWPSGWYSGIAWSTIRFTGETNYVLDSEGDYVLDSNGQRVTSTSLTGGTNFAPLYCMAATWDATTRFSQTITENKTLTVTAPQSVTQFGTIEQSESYSTEDSFDSQLWETYEVYSDLGLGSGNFTINQDTNRNQTNAAIVTVLNKARTTILNSHRDSRVAVSRFLWPQLDLKHTVEIDTTTIQTKGKVFSIQHRLNINTSEAVTSVSIALFQAVGSASDSSFVAPGQIADTNNYGSGTIVLGNHFGEAPQEEWNGMIGNRILPGGLGRTQYTDQFIVDTPAIPDSVRNAKDLSSSNSYNVAIPNDDLTIIF